MTTCTGCNNKSKYRVHAQLEPHCEDCFQEAIEGCTVPTVVMTEEAYQELLKRGQVA